MELLGVELGQGGHQGDNHILEFTAQLRLQVGCQILLKHNANYVISNIK